MLFILLLLLPGFRGEEPTPSSLLSPRNFNHHPFDAVQFIKRIKSSKKGPILFPNDGPTPPPTPLIVTSRPLIESIRRSELNANNTIEAPSQVNQVAFSPKLLSRLKSYEPFVFSIPTATPVYKPFNFVDNGQVNKDGYGYDDYEQRTELPIYRAFTSHPNNILAQQKPVYQQQAKSPDYTSYHHDHDSSEKTSKEYNHGENYAFSYTVRDRKTGDDFSHSQRSIGAATNGEYRVRLPDGRMQIVSYTADENGYKADVRYDDQETHDHTDNNRIDTESSEKNPYNNDYTYNRYLTNDEKIQYRPIVSNNDYKVVNKDKQFNDYDDKTEYHNNNDRHTDYILRDNDPVYLNDNNNDKTFTNNNEKKQRNQDTDYYNYSDDNTPSKEYKDYSVENTDYQPHKSKYSQFAENKMVVKSTVKPSYEELKDIFISKLFRSPSLASIYSTLSPNRFASVSSTLAPNYETTTEKVVLIGGKRPSLFTNIQSLITANTLPPTPLVYSTPASPIASTPSSYLYSTITNLKNKVNELNKPVLSSKYIDKINKYLSYK